MSIAWVPYWKKLFATRSIPIIIRQNYRLLEGMGEPVYLLVRGRKVDFFKNQVEWTVSDIIPDGNFCYFLLWKMGNDIKKYPDIRDITIKMDGQDMINVVLKDFLTDKTHFAPVIIKQNEELNIEHEVRIYFHKDLLTETHNFIAEYIFIHPEFDTVYWQMDSVKESKGAQYGWRQPVWRGCYYKDKFIKGAFLIALPDIRRDLVLERSGFVTHSDYDAWTSPPPLSPILNEHDIIVRLNGLRYEVRDMTRNIIENMWVQQEFRISEIEPSNPVYEVEVDTVKGKIKGFPEEIYTGI